TGGSIINNVITHQTIDVVTAIFASLGDYNFAEPGALIGFAGRRVIEQTTREKLPKDFQTSEFLFKHGQLDRIVHRHEMKELLTTILALHAVEEVAEEKTPETKVVSVEGGQTR